MSESESDSCSSLFGDPGLKLSSSDSDTDSRSNSEDDFDFQDILYCQFCSRCDTCENCLASGKRKECIIPANGKSHMAECDKCYGTNEYFRWRYPEYYSDPEENGERKDCDNHRDHHEGGNQNQRILGHNCIPRVIVPGPIPDNPEEIFFNARRIAKKLLWTLFIWLTKASLFDGRYNGKWVAGLYDPETRHISISKYCTANMKELLLALLHEAMHSLFNRLFRRIQRNLFTHSEEEGLCEIFARYLECWSRGEKEPSLENYTSPAYDDHFNEAMERFFPGGVSFDGLKRFIKKLLQLPSA